MLAAGLLSLGIWWGEDSPQKNHLMEQKETFELCLSSPSSSLISLFRYLVPLCNVWTLSGPLLWVFALWF